MFMLESAVTLPKEGVFTLIGIAVLLILYLALRFVKSKKKEEPVEIIEEVSDEEIAAITAAVALILEEEAEREERKPTPFRVVSFKRTNKRRIGD
jgi:uncharacterized protein YpmS